MQLSRYEESNVRIENDEIAIKYVKDNIKNIWTKEPVYMHGDFHPGNLIYMNDGSIGVIDFNRWEVGDPYEEFYKLDSFGIELSVPYCIGQVDAYFDDDIPLDFGKYMPYTLIILHYFQLSGLKSLDKVILMEWLEEQNKHLTIIMTLANTYQIGIQTSIV